MNKSRVVLAGIIISLFVSSALFVGLWADEAQKAKPKVQEANKLESFKKLRRIMGIVEENYVDKRDTNRDVLNIFVSSKKVPGTLGSSSLH